MPKKVIIIGAGIAGLSAGCYARMNDYEAEIYEAHTLPGGLCTSWKRKGYTFDGCIDWLVGTAPGTSFYPIWRELGATQGHRILQHKIFFRYPDWEGRSLTVFCDVAKLEAHLKEIAPQDSETIGLFCRLVRKFTKFKAPVAKPFELYNLFDFIQLMFNMMPFSKDLNYCNSITVGEFSRRFKDPLLRDVFPKMIGDEDYTLLGLVVTLAGLSSGDSGFPEGGSLPFARGIEKRFLDLGGKISYKSRVEKVLEENGRATGIRLADGREVKGDYVISAADLHTTLYQMLEGKHVDPMHKELFATCRLVPSTVQVTFGLNMDLSSQPESMGDFIKFGTIANHKVDCMMVKNYCFDKTMAPPGKSVVKCILKVEDYEYWEKLYLDKAAYKAEKERISAAVAGQLEQRIPGFKSAIEATDVATPMTYVRYTGNWKGTYMTWLITPDKAKKFRTITKTVQGLDNFWLSGMWVQPPGGTPSAAMSSRGIIQLICKKDKRRFQTSTP